MRLMKIWCLFWTALFFAGFWLLLYSVVHFPFDALSFDFLFFVNMGQVTLGATIRFLIGVNMAGIWIFFTNTCLLEVPQGDVRKTNVMRK